MKNLEFINSEKIVKVEFEDFWERNSLEFSKWDKFITIENPYYQRYIDDQKYVEELVKEYKKKFWLSNKTKVKKINKKLEGRLFYCQVYKVRDDYGYYSEIEIKVLNKKIREYEEYLKEAASNRMKGRFDIDYHNPFVDVYRQDFSLKEYSYFFNSGLQYFYGENEKINEFIEKYYDKKIRMIITTTRGQDEYILTPKEAEAYINKFKLNNVYIEMSSEDTQKERYYE